jgi:hypothetical protein
MDEVDDFCVRMLGDGEPAAEAARLARGSEGADRVRLLRAAVEACRQLADGAEAPRAPEPDADLGLVEAVAGELAGATARLPQRQREALALRERLGLSYREIAGVIKVESAAVAPLLARARLRLRSELRGTPSPPGDCPERDRALRTIASRQDSEEVPVADEDWLLEHLGHCAGCAQTHSAMLEASACYRAWRRREPASRGSGTQAAAGAPPVR